MLRPGALHAPELLDVEFLHSVRRRVLRGEWTAERGAQTLGRLVRLRVRLHGHRRLMARAWELRDAVSAYDAQYVALAELLGATLVTGDVRLSRAPGLRCEVRVLAA